MMNGPEQLKSDKPLGTDINPFSSGAGAPRACGPVQTALGEVIGLIERKCPVVVVAGGAGTGKTLLVDMIACACSDVGLSVRQIDRGDFTSEALATPSAVLLIDDAHSIPAADFNKLTSPEGSMATTCVLLGRPASVSRIHCPAASIVELKSLSSLDARTYLLEQAKSIGRCDLFSPDAMAMIVHRASGSCRSLRSIASLAFSTAAWEQETQISVKHVTEVLESPMLSVPVVAVEPKVPRNDSASQSEPNHLPGRASGFPEVIRAGRQIEVSPLKQLAVRRTGRLAAIAVGIAAFIGLASAAPWLFVSTGDEIGSSVGRPQVQEPLVAAIGPAPTLAVSPAGTDQKGSASHVEPLAAVIPSVPVLPAKPADQTGSVSDATKPTAAPNSPPPIARQPITVSRNLSPKPRARARTVMRPASSAPGSANRLAALTKRSSPPARATTQRSNARQAAAKIAEERAREAQERARQAEDAAHQAAEAARQAADAQREADNAARRADDAVRYATEAVRHAEDAARQAEAVARQADRRVRIIFRP